MIERGKATVESLRGRDSDGRFWVVQLGRLVLQLSITKEKR